MSFHSYKFILVFLPVLLMLYHATGLLFPLPETRARVRKLLIGCASMLYICTFGIECIAYLALHLCLNLAFAWNWRQTADRDNPDARSLCSQRAQYILLLFLDIGLLVICKIWLRAIPVGMSFYTFTQIAFITDVYRGDIKSFTLAEYLIHTMFFPRFLQGPIMRFSETKDIITGNRIRAKATAQAVWGGATLFSLGLAKKVLIADTLGGMLDTAYSVIPDLTRPDAVLTILLFPAQLYFDFSGYCDMGMGVARMMGLDLPVNFRVPLRATNIVSYWKQWHMTLTSFFTRYLYLPLGGNRRGRANTYRNIMIVFLVSGFWHGTGLTYLIWGTLHGICYCLTVAWSRKREAVLSARTAKTPADGLPAGARRGKKALQGLKTAASVASTYLLVSVIYVFFRAPRVSDALNLFGRAYGALVNYVSDTVAKTFHMDEIWYLVKLTPFAEGKYTVYICMAVFLAVLFLLLFFVPCARDLTERVSCLAEKGSGRFVLTKCACFTFCCAILFVWALISTSDVGTYLYVNF
ncbi:MAG: MBOAT family protein [Lachnospiraceae bacterium]|nr:MBOAT family protein [Lachnospiraceae bacterium]